MNKQQFLGKLDKALSALNNEERKRQLDFYAEMIDDMVEDGMSEESAVERIGSVQGVSGKILREATPEQFEKRKKIGVLGWIGIALGAVALLIAVLCVAFLFDHAEETYEIQVEDKIEQKLGLEDGWIFGADAKLPANEVSAIEIVWNCGNVTVDEAEGRDIVVNAGKDNALEYQIRDGILYIGNSSDVSKSNINLKVLIPEDIMQMNKLSVTTSAGDVMLDSEYFADVNVVTTSGNVRLSAEDAMNISAVSDSGNIALNLDEDDAFVMDYASKTGKVSVGFDFGFKNESGTDANGEAIKASYDHSRGFANCMKIDIVTVSGDIKLIDD